MKITLKGVEHEASKALPMVWGDYRKLKKEHAISQKDLRDGGDDAMFAFALVAAQKINPAVTAEDIEALPLDVGYAFIKFVADGAKAELDRPISGSSTS